MSRAQINIYTYAQTFWERIYWRMRVCCEESAYIKLPVIENRSAAVFHQFIHSIKIIKVTS